MHRLVDSTGLKLCGSGKWLLEKHGTKTLRRWRKLHIAVDADTGQIAAVALTANAVGDVIVPPRSRAVPSDTAKTVPTTRDVI